MHLDGMKQEDAEEFNLLGTAVAGYPALSPKVKRRVTRNNRKSHFTLWIFRFI